MNSKENQETDHQQSIFCKYCHIGLDDLRDSIAHDICKKIMENQTKHKRIDGKLSMGYYKQGYDFAKYLERREKGGFDVIKSCNKYKERMIEQVKRISNFLDAFKVERDSDLKLDHKLKLIADTHMIFLQGPKSIIQRFVRQGVLELHYYDEEMMDIEDEDM